MVTTTEILPCLSLQSYIRCYTLREFNTAGSDFIKPIHANHELTLAFILAGNLSSYKGNSTDYIANARKHIIGLQTLSKGSVVFKGNIKLLTIHFRPNGYYRLFSSPPEEITNNIYEVADVEIKGMNEYNDRLNDAKSLQEIKNVSDKFFVSHINRIKTTDPYCSITSTSLVIFKTHGNVNIKALANDANMSLRSFEMKFIQQVGVSPKLFARITRFNFALLVKMKNLTKSWTDVCHDCGYYDQMHFIKEFKEFAGESPLNFFKATPLPVEDYRKQQ